jgi:SRSO17 transposase
MWRVTKAKRIDEAAWEAEFERWLEPFLNTFDHEAQQKWAPVYLRGLLAPGERKSVEPMAARVCPGETQQLHHFVATSMWAIEGHEQILLQKAQQLVGGKDAHLIVDDTALVKKGRHSVGVGHQYCGQLGKSANCQALVSLTLAREEVPVPIALQLYLPKDWAEDAERRRRAKVPDAITFQPKWRIALDQIERVVRAGVTFGGVLADAGYGACAGFRQGLTDLGLTWAVGISAASRVYPRSVRVTVPGPTCASGRRPTLAKVSAQPRSAKQVFTTLGKKAFNPVQWRRGTKGMLEASFAAVRVRASDGPRVLGHRHGPGQEVWLVCERRRSGETKYYMANHEKETDLQTLVAAIKARWVCEQAHQQLKEELGLDHFEGRSWTGLHHHALLTMIACAFLQHLRLLENKAEAQRAAA